ncbi:DUF4007 family protein [Streptomyces cellulosae]|uniref:DUF4007 family protein n=1 Tax=Streptomyces cellulosae TaxID=1968 RepID=A0ABW6JEE4_STRCE
MTGNPPLNGCTPTWAGHGNYPPRYGWLSKTYNELTADPATFTRPDVTVRLGVGSSQVRAMRFWTTAFGLAAPARGPHQTGLTPTGRGTWLLNLDTGADPYQEDPGTQWLLHWWLLSRDACPTPTIHYLIADAPLSTYRRVDAIAAVRRAARRIGWTEPSTDLVSRDLTAFLAMYAHEPNTAERGTPEGNRLLEDAAFNPWRSLHLVLRVPGQQDVFQINRHAGKTAPKHVLAYACLDHAARTSGGHTHTAMSRLHTDSSGPGRVMLADHATLYRALETTAARLPELGLDIDDSAEGGPRLHWTGTASEAAQRILADYYDLPDGPPEPRTPRAEALFQI